MIETHAYECWVPRHGECQHGCSCRCHRPPTHRCGYTYEAHTEPCEFSHSAKDANAASTTDCALVQTGEGKILFARCPTEAEARALWGDR